MESEEFQIQDMAKFQTNIVCSNCCKFLNVEPIECIVDPYNIKIKCGRCPENNSTKCKILRQYAYESFAQFITFPCSNREFGCQTILDWGNVMKHERECSFQKVVCPLSYAMLFPGEENCTWSGIANTLNNHIINSHKEYILNPAVIDLIVKKEYNSIFFTEVGTQIITVVIKFEMERLSFLLMLNGSDVESQCFNFKLELFDENKVHSVLLHKNRLQSLFAMLDNIEKYDTILRIEISKIRDLLKTSGNIIGRLEIKKKQREEIEQVMGLKIEQLLNAQDASSILKEIVQEVCSVDEELLQELECPVCHEYMIPPIYICENGHSLCGTCKPKVSGCPNCRGVMLHDTRNVSLEKLTTKVYYPCRNKDNGCKNVTTSEAIRHHEKICRFKEMKCILYCGEICKTPAMMKHLVDNHNDELLSQYQTVTYMLGNARYARVVKTYGELFHLSIQEIEQHIHSFEIHHLCMDKDKEAKFKYNLTISNPSRSSKSISFSDVCSIWIEDGDNNSSRISVSWDLLKSYVHENTFCYNLVFTKTK